MALIKEYFELTEIYQKDYGINTILLMQVGAFYEVYGLFDTTKNIVTGSFGVFILQEHILIMIHNNLQIIQRVFGFI